MSDWQPIETAPKDGSRFVAGCYHHIYGWLWGAHRYYEDAGVPGGGYFAGDCGHATHWMPLPSPPLIDASPDTAQEQKP